MDWSQVLYAGLGGGAGAGLGGFIALAINKKIKDTKYHKGIRAAFTGGLAVLGMNFTKSMYADMQLPRVGASVEKMFLESSPIYVEMKKYEPEYFKKIMETVDVSARKGSDAATIMNEGRAILTQLLADKAKYADDETLKVIIEIARQNYLDYKQNKPYLCVLMINQRGMGEVAPYTSTASDKLEQEYTLKMVRLPRHEAKLIDMAMAKNSEKNILAELMKKIKPGDVMDLPEDAPQEKLEGVCDIGVATMDAILALPEPERSNYIRSTFGQ